MLTVQAYELFGMFSINYLCKVDAVSPARSCPAAEETSTSQRYF